MSQFVTDRSYDYFDLGDESDQEAAESSEDEIDIILHGTPEQRRRLCQSRAKEQRRKATGRQQNALQSKKAPQQAMADTRQESSSEDEFEKEMNAELDNTVSMLEKSRGFNKAIEGSSTASGSGTTDTTQTTTTTTTNKSSAEKKPEPFYNAIYFDSDDEDNFEGEGEARAQKHHTKLTNDDLLYDPNMDDDDQRWVDRQRSGARNAASFGAPKADDGKHKKRTKRASARKSDAVLDCPACMTTLCLDCQRHDIYPDQFRAMFVMNCKVNHSETLSVPEQATKKKKFKKSSKKSSTATSGQSQEASETCGGEGIQAAGGNGAGESASNSCSVSNDQFHPVMCVECDTVVGVMDVDEVYHFFNVLVSRA